MPRQSFPDPLASRQPPTSRIPADLLRFVVPEPVFPIQSTAVWRRLLADHTEFLQSFASHIDASYIAGFEALALDTFEIPALADINGRLNTIGWRAAFVDGYIPTPVYARLLQARIFPVAAFLRSDEHVDHSPAPDFAHDVLGHLPLLFCARHREYLQRLAQLILTATDSPANRELFLANKRMSSLIAQSAPEHEIASAQRRVEQASAADCSAPSEETELGRIFLWSVEFGLVGGPRGHRILGAGLLSSPCESRLACRPTVTVRPYSLDVIRHDIEFSSPQSCYFVASGYGAFHDVLDQYEALRADRREFKEDARVAAYA